MSTIEQQTAGILYFHVFKVLQDCVWDVIFMKNEAENLQNSEIHLAQVLDFLVGYLENHLAQRCQCMAHFCGFFCVHFLLF